MKALSVIVTEKQIVYSIALIWYILERLKDIRKLNTNRVSCINLMNEFLQILSGKRTFGILISDFIVQRLAK